MFVSVLLNNPLGQRFTYLVPPDCNAQVGMRAVVPFGNREVTAYIVEVLETIEAICSRTSNSPPLTLSSPVPNRCTISMG
jgi:primosomal protein N'